jgi:ribosomal-protein-alanine N-acetyltransferase
VISIFQGDARDISRIMPIMDDAFDPAFGEAWTAAQCLSLLSLPSCQLVLAELDNQIVGFAMTRWVLDEEELLMIGVARFNQRSKIGSCLLQHVIDQARSQNRSKLFLEVRSGNAAQDFYKNKKFSIDGIRKQYYRGADGSSYDAITMTLLL